MSIKRAFPKAKSGNVLGQPRRPSKVFRAGLYARVSTNDQQMLSMQSRAMREYAARRGWTITVNVREVGSGVAKREAREKLLEAAARSMSCWCGGWTAGAERYRISKETVNGISRDSPNREDRHE